MAPIDQFFPNLSRSGFKETSPWDTKYNCLAWAAHNSDRWWEPDPFRIQYWPDGVTREYTLNAYIEAYSSLSYEPCENPDLEQGFEKVAIYVDSQNKPMHAARQLVSGKWTSKLGNDIDIEHELEGLTGATYGHVGIVMRRPLKTPPRAQDVLYYSRNTSIIRKKADLFFF